MRTLFGATSFASEIGALSYRCRTHLRFETARGFFGNDENRCLDTKKVENELLFLPTNVTSGIQPSDDPITSTRTKAYAESFGRCTK